MLNENSPTLKTERLILRKFEDIDTQALLEILSDPEVNTFLPWFPLRNIEESKQFLYQNFIDYYKQASAYRYAICLKEDNRPIGYVWLSSGDSRDFGYGLRKEFWNLGIAQEASKAVIERIREAGYTYITATRDINNPRSGNVLKKLGMVYKYSYVEQWQPKNIPITFRLYQINFDHQDRTYMEYWDKYAEHFIENDV